MTYRTSDSNIITIDSLGVVKPINEGAATVIVELNEWSKTIPVTVEGLKTPRPVSFRSDIQPILTKAACNSGGCHGKAEGQNGFKLSVFAFDDDFDHDSITRHGRGRRINIASPASSLLLKKATGLLPHGGGRKVPVDGLWHHQLQRWIAEGASLDEQGSN